MQFRHTTFVLAAAGALFAGCMHPGAEAAAAGDVAIDPAVAANTVVLRVQNNHDSEMKMFWTLDGQEHYLGPVLAHHTRDFALDPSLVGNPSVTFTARRLDNSDALVRGPYQLDRGSIVGFVIPKRDVDMQKHPLVPPL
jgi:hypothetical protein